MKWLNWIKTPAALILRTQQISFVLSRHGVAGTLSDLGLAIGKKGFSAATQSSRPSPSLGSVFGKSLVATFVELGPTFIKLGQMLAQRPDWVGEEISIELREIGRAHV